jgi:predicted GNAT superfamily acetyltransferase
LPPSLGKLRPATPADFPEVLALNEQSVRFLSPLGASRLEQLHAAAALHDVIEQGGSIVAFLLAFREGADYDSVNYAWFARRYARFLYIDRVVVAPEARAQGAGSMLYGNAFQHAARAVVPILACEFDLEPANPVSARFHAKFGFREVGRQYAGDGKKRVSLQTAEVRPADQAAPG